MLPTPHHCSHTAAAALHSSSLSLSLCSALLTAAPPPLALLFSSLLLFFSSLLLSLLPPAAMPELKVGDQFPTHITSVTEGTPGNHIDLAKEIGTGKVIIFGVPGAFTPGCSNTHLPSFLKDYDNIKSKGVDKIICLSVNDAFVMHGTRRQHTRSLSSTHLCWPTADLLPPSVSSPLLPTASSLGGGSPRHWQDPLLRRCQRRAGEGHRPRRGREAAGRCPLQALQRRAQGRQGGAAQRGAGLVRTHLLAGAQAQAVSAVGRAWRGDGRAMRVTA